LVLHEEKALHGDVTMLVLITTALAHYYGDSTASIYDANCQCSFNCEYCKVSGLLSNEIQSASGRVNCKDPNAPPPNVGQQAWKTLTSPNDATQSGYCVSSISDAGEYMTVHKKAATAGAADTMTKELCEAACAEAPACMAYEWNGKCELHADVPTAIQPRIGDVVCRVKDPLPNYRPLVDSPCCPTFEAQLKNQLTTGFSLRVRPCPWVPGKNVILQLPNAQITDPNVRVTFQRASFVGLADGQGGVITQPPDAANPGRRLCGSCHSSAQEVAGTTLTTTGIVIKLAERDYDTFDITFTYTATATAPIAIDTRLTCAQSLGQGQLPVSQPPSLPSFPPLPLDIPDAPGQSLVAASPYAVKITLTAAGAVESFDAESQRACASRLAKAARVDESMVSVSVRPGSVELDVRMQVASKDEAYATKKNLKDQMPNKEAASEVSGVNVEKSPQFDVDDPDEKDYYFRYLLFMCLWAVTFCCLAPYCFLTGARKPELADKIKGKLKGKKADKGSAEVAKGSVVAVEIDAPSKVEAPRPPKVPAKLELEDVALEEAEDGQSKRKPASLRSVSSLHMGDDDEGGDGDGEKAVPPAAKASRQSEAPGKAPEAGVLATQGGDSDAGANASAPAAADPPTTTRKQSSDWEEL
jgi:hypothetical protein